MVKKIFSVLTAALLLFPLLPDAAVQIKNGAVCTADRFIGEDGKPHLFTAPSGPRAEALAQDGEISPKASLTPKGEDPSVFTVQDGVLEEYNGDQNFVYIPSELGITKIGSSVFGQNANIEGVAIPEGVTEIADAAFISCVNLDTITFPQTLTKIGDMAFNFCTSLKTVHLPQNLTHIGEKAFADSGITAIAIWDSVTEIGSNAIPAGNGLTVYGIEGSFAETYANSRGNTFIATQPSIYIEDANLKNVLVSIHDKDGNGELSSMEMQEITVVDIFGYTPPITSIKGLEYAVNLSYLHAYENEIADLSPIKDLTNMKFVDIGYNKINLNNETQWNIVTALRNRGCYLSLTGQLMHDTMIPRLSYETEALFAPESNFGLLVNYEVHDADSMVSIQWYQVASPTNSGGTEVSTTVTDTAEGTYYYYAEVTNTNMTAEGSQTASVTTEPITIKVALPWQSVSEPNFAGGNGTSENPYLIETANQLATLSTPSPSGYYRIMNDIDLSGRPWQAGNFVGHLDGNFMVVSNASLIPGTYSSVGFFAYADGSIRNLGLENIYEVAINDTWSSETGGLVSQLSLNSVIENCFTTGKITSGYGRGGLVGRSKGVIKNCFSTVDISLNAYAHGGDNLNQCSGGLVGHIEDGRIEKSYATGKVPGYGYEDDTCGGLVSSCTPSVANRVVNSYYNEEYRNPYLIDESLMGTPKNASQLRQKATFASWDFTNIWDITPTRNTGLPVLRGYASSAPDPFAVSFKDIDGQDIVEPILAIPGGAIEPPEPPEVIGKIFTGWFTELTGGTERTDFSEILSDLVMYARYEDCFYNVTFFDSDGETALETLSIGRGASIENTPTPTEIVGKVFIGWFDDFTVGNEFEEFGPVFSDLSVYSRYETARYTVTFMNEAGDTLVQTGEVLHGEAVTQPDTEKEGYLFNGWYTALTDGELVEDFTAITSNLTLYPRYSIILPIYTVTFMSQDGAEVLQTTEVESGSPVTTPTPAEIEGYYFDGWFTEQTGGTKVTNFGYIESDLTIYARYSIVVLTAIFYDVNGQPIKTADVEYGSDAQPPEPPVVLGSEFLGWYTAQAGGELITDFTALKQDLRAYAIYEVRQCYVTFIGTKEGSETVEVGFGMSLTPLKAATKKGWTFVGWFTEAEIMMQPENFEAIYADMTLTAVYEETIYDITFLYGAQEIAVVKAPYGTAISPPIVTPPQGKMLDGWYTADIGGNKQTQFVFYKNGTLFARFVDITGDVSGEKIVTGSFRYDSVIGAPASERQVKITKSGSSTSVSQFTDANGQLRIALEDGQYTLEIASNSLYNKFTKEFTVNTSGGTTDLGAMVIAPKFSSKALSVGVTKGDAPINGALVTIMNTPYLINVSKNTNANGMVGFPALRYDDVAGTNYTVTCNYGSYMMTYSSVNIKDINDLKIEIPDVYNLSGKCTLGDIGIANIRIEAYQGDKLAAWAITDSAGKYVFTNLEKGEYSLTTKSTSVYYAAAQNVTVDTDISDLNIALTNTITVTGKVTVDGAISNKAGISLYEGDQLVAQGEVIDQRFTLEGAIKKAGTYKLVADYARINNVNIDFEPYEVIISVPTLQDSIEGLTRERDLNLHKKTDPNLAFAGEGNVVTTDVEVVVDGMNANVIVKYKNNSSAKIDNAVFTVNLPNGLVTQSSRTHVAPSLNPGDTGRFSIQVKANRPTGAHLKIEVDLTYGNISKIFGACTVDVAGIRLNAPGVVNEDTSFVFYGEAPADSIVAIKDTETGETIAVTTPDGKWFSARVDGLPTGTYSFIAEAVADWATVLSNVVEIESVVNPPILSEAFIDGYNMKINKYSGTPTYNLWTDTAGNGIPFEVSAKFDNDSAIKSVKYSFAGYTFNSSVQNRLWNGRLNEWHTSGSKSLVATVTMNNDTVYSYTVAEITVLIDPSGYVYDKETKGVLAGITVICEVFEDGEWKFWEADKYGQENPQTTDSEGRYGWMVPEGVYRVIAVSENHLPYSTDQDPDPNIREIIIPPVRTDVNLALTPSVLVTAINLNTESLQIRKGNTEKLTATVVPQNATNANRFKFTSSDPNIATVMADGTVTAISVGMAEITASIGEFSATCYVEVTQSTTRVHAPNVQAGSSGIVTAPISEELAEKATQTATEPTVAFADVPKGFWAEQAINELWKQGIINGKEEGMFCPNDNVKREEFVKMLIGISDLPLSNQPLEFTDTDNNEWYAPFIATAVENNVVNGYEDGSFGIASPITRQEIATIIYRTFKDSLPQGEIIEFSDSETISDFAKEAVEALTSAKIINGYAADNTFKPQNQATRAEAATMLYRVLILIPE